MFQVKSNYILRDVDEKQGIVTGYCSVFNNIDSDGDMIVPGAFAKTISERGPGCAKPRIKHLWQHNSWEPIGIPTVLREEPEGLYFETVFGKDRFSQDKLQQHIDKIITELSIGYNTIKKEEVIDGNDDSPYRKLTELKLWEYSSVTWGANELTSVISAKGESIEILADLSKRMDNLNSALKNSKYTDETCEQFEAEIEKIKSIIKSLEIKEPAIATPEPEPTVDYKEHFKSLLTIIKNH